MWAEAEEEWEAEGWQDVWEAKAEEWEAEGGTAAGKSARRHRSRSRSKSARRNRNKVSFDTTADSQAYFENIGRCEVRGAHVGRQDGGGEEDNDEEEDKTEVEEEGKEGESESEAAPTAEEGKEDEASEAESESESEAAPTAPLWGNAPRPFIERWRSPLFRYLDQMREAG